MNTRRQFLITAAMAAVASGAACRREQRAAGSAPPEPPGAPPTFGTGPLSGPPVSTTTFAEAEKLAQVTMSSADREMAAASWRRSMAPLLERRTGPRTVSLAPDLAPATAWNPAIPGVTVAATRDRFIRTAAESQPLPANDADIAFATVTQLSRWIERKALTSERLTSIYLDRIRQHDARLRCVITLTADAAL